MRQGVWKIRRQNRTKAELQAVLDGEIKKASRKPREARN